MGLFFFSLISISILYSPSSLSSSDGLSFVSAFQFNATHPCIETLKASDLHRHSLGFNVLSEQKCVCTWTLASSANLSAPDRSLTLTCYHQTLHKCSQLDAFLNPGPRNQIVNDCDRAVSLQRCVLNGSCWTTASCQRTRLAFEEGSFSFHLTGPPSCH